MRGVVEEGMKMVVKWCLSQRKQPLVETSRDVTSDFHFQYFQVSTMDHKALHVDVASTSFLPTPLQIQNYNAIYKNIHQ